MAFLRRVTGFAAVACVTLLAGCGNFFVCDKASCTVSPTPPVSNSGDFVYVSNSAAGGPNSIAGYTITDGVLASISGASYDLGFTPVALRVSANNAFLYVASDAGATVPGIYLFTISSTGALTEGNNNAPVVSDATISTMTISPDGNYMYTLGTTELGVILSQYTLDTSTGIPTGSTTFTTTATSCALNITGTPAIQQCSITVSPSEEFVAVAQGQQGVLVYPYTSTAGATNYDQAIAAISSTSGDYSLAFDSNNNLYVSSTLALTPYTGIGGTGTPVAGTAVAYPAGNTPRSVTVTASNSYLYTANVGVGTISTYSVTTAGVLTAVGTAITGPGNVSALGVDNSGKYLVAGGYNATNGIQVFTIGSTGALTTTGSTAGTGASTTTPMLIALTH